MLKDLIALFVVLLLSACGGKQADKTDVGLGWSPQNVRITCPSGDCPDATGALIIGRRTYNGYRIGRCTATLIAADTIITNAHCDDDFGDLSYAWFITRNGIANVTAKTYEYIGAVSGIERDLAIFKLNRAMPGHPKSVSRKIPARMDRLIAYVIDQSYGDGDFTALDLNKRSCRVERTVPLIGGGYDDKTLGLAVFDCEVKHGNSGSAMYVPDDMENIQALMNTLWNWNEVGGRSGLSAKNLFLETPAFMKSEYGMAERLQCASIPGFAEPEELCTKLDADATTGAKLREALAAKAERWLQSLASGAGGVEWTLETVDGELSEGYFMTASNRAAALIPVPYCFTGEPQTATLRVPYFRLGLLSVGAGEARLVSEKEVSMRFARQSSGKTVVSAVWRDLNYERSRFRASREAAARHNELTGTYRTLEIPKCTYAARLEARQKAIDGVNAAIHVPEIKF
jgi:hypothetical protein